MTHKLVLLSKSVQLGVSIEHARADELVKDAQNERREDGEDDVVESKCPRLLEDLTREGALDRELKEGKMSSAKRCRFGNSADPEACHVQHDILVEPGTMNLAKVSAREAAVNEEAHEYRMSLLSRW